MPFDGSSMAALLDIYQRLSGSEVKLSGEFENVLPAPPSSVALLPPESPPPTWPPLANSSNSTGVNMNQGSISARQLLQIPPQHTPRDFSTRLMPQNYFRSRRTLVEISELDMSGCAALGGTKAVVAITVSTVDKNKLDALLALGSGSPEAEADLAAVAVNGSAGEHFSLCTPTVVIDESRRVNPAPSPPPPTQPPPPPFREGLGGLEVQDFVNISNPVGVALNHLLTQSAQMVQTVTAAAVTASAAAAVVASAAGSAGGGGGALAAIGGAQRIALMSSLGGPPMSCEDPRATSSGGWTMGRFGIARKPHPCELIANASSAFSDTNRNTTGSFSNDEGRRRLQSQRGSSGGGTGGLGGGKRQDEAASEFVLVESDDEEDIQQRILAAALEDTAISVAAIMGALFCVHLLILLCWRFRVNGRYYAWVKRGPTHIVAIKHELDEPLGIHFEGNCIQSTDAASLCAGVLNPGDKVFLINGARVVSGYQASKLICAKRELFFLVSRPATQPGATWNGSAWERLGPRLALGILRPSSGQQSEKYKTTQLDAGETAIHSKKDSGLLAPMRSNERITPPTAMRDLARIRETDSPPPSPPDVAIVVRPNAAQCDAAVRLQRAYRVRRARTHLETIRSYAAELKAARRLQVALRMQLLRKVNRYNTAARQLQRTFRNGSFRRQWNIPGLPTINLPCSPNIPELPSASMPWLPTESCNHTPVPADDTPVSRSSTASSSTSITDKPTEARAFGAVTRNGDRQCQDVPAADRRSKVALPVVRHSYAEVVPIRKLPTPRMRQLYEQVCQNGSALLDPAR